MEQSPSWEGNLFSFSQEIPRILCNTKRINAFTSACHLSLSWTSSIQSITPHPNSRRSNLLLSSHLRLGLPSILFPSGFPTKTMYKLLLSPLRATCPAHLRLLDFIARKTLDEQFRSLSSSLCTFLSSPITLPLLGPNILRYTLLSNNFSQRSSLSMSDRVSHPCTTTGKIIVLYILIFKFLVSKFENKMFCAEW